MTGYYIIKKDSNGKVSIFNTTPSYDIIQKLSYNRPVLTGKYSCEKPVTRPVFVVMATDRKDALDKYTSYIKIPVK